MIAKTTDPIASAHPVAVAGIMMPTDVVRLSAGGGYMTDEFHALCLFAGANSMFIGEMLLITPNSSQDSEPGFLEHGGNKLFNGRGDLKQCLPRDRLVAFQNPRNRRSPN
jgi:biotin synthase-like enzyme